jgi:hypothetical protein
MKLGVITLATLLVACSGCEPKPVTPERWQDAGDTPEGAAKGTPCHRAAARVHALKCSFDRPDFETFCVSMLDAGVPLCPVKLAAAKTCAEMDGACR